MLEQARIKEEMNHMAEKTFNTRIQLKYDTYQNWTTNDPVLKAGEMALATIESNVTGVNSAPTVLIKVGDGTHKYSELPYASGKAADVYSWAKSSTKPTYSATEIQGLDDYISGEIQDTNTKYQIVQDGTDGHILRVQHKEVGESTWTTDATITVPDDSYDDTALAGRVSSLETLVGNTAVATQISNAITAIGLKPVATSGAAADVTIADTGNNYTSTTVEGALAEIATALDSAGAVTMTTNTSPQDTSLVKQYTLSQNGSTIGTIDIPKDLVAVSGEIVSQDGSGNSGTFIKLTIQNGSPFYIDVASLIEYNSVADTDEIDMTESASHQISATIKTGSIALTKLASSVQTSIGKADTALQSADITTGTTNGTIKVKNSEVAVAGLGSAAYAATTAFDAAGTAAAAIADLDSSVSATAANGNVYSVLTGVTQTDGELTGKTEVTLAAIAKTGNVNDLVQTSGDVMVLNCGSSSVLV
jgi:hypothetical protein